MGCHFLLQGVFRTQVLKPGLPHCRQTRHFTVWATREVKALSKDGGLGGSPMVRMILPLISVWIHPTVKPSQGSFHGLTAMAYTLKSVSSLWILTNPPLTYCFVSHWIFAMRHQSLIFIRSWGQASWVLAGLGVPGESCIYPYYLFISWISDLTPVAQSSVCLIFYILSEITISYCRITLLCQCKFLTSKKALAYCGCYAIMFLLSWPFIITN